MKSFSVRLALLSALLVTASATTTIAQVKPAAAAAATPAAPKTNLETFSERSGSLLKKTTLDVGKVKNVEVQVLTMTDVVNQKSIAGIRLEAYVASTYSSDTKVAFLDSDEIDGLLKAISYLNDNVLNGASPTDYTEVSFTSRSGFKAGVFNDVRKKTWSGYIQLEKYDGRSNIFLSTEEFIKLRDLVAQAKTKL